MFELSDDDDEFWETEALWELRDLAARGLVLSQFGAFKDLPLLDVTKKTESKNKEEIDTKRQCLEKENIDSGNGGNNINDVRQIKTPSLPTLVLPVPVTDFASPNHQQTAHRNKITCGFFTPVKSPDERTNQAGYSEKSGQRKQGVQMHDSTSSGLRTPNMARDTTPREIRTPNMARGTTPREITPNMAGTPNTAITRDTTPTNITSPSTPADIGIPGNVRTSSVLQELPGRRGKRKFPGPAGRLPKLKPGEAMNKSTTVSPESENKVPQDVIMCSQVNDDVFNESSWKMLKQDLGPDAEVILDQFSVSSSLSMASKKTLPHGKIPLLFVIVESIDLQGAGGSVVLKDKTGRIKGTLHRDVIKEYGADIQPGTTLVLRQVGVVSPSIRTHYLNITPTNMVYLNSNTSTLNKHLVHHRSLKHFMADFKRKRKQQQLGENNSVSPGTPQRFSTSINQTPANCQHTPTSASFGRTITPNIRSCATGNAIQRPTFNCDQRETTPISVKSRLSENFGGSLIANPALQQRATTPNSVNGRLSAPNQSFSAPVGNMTPTSTLHINQRATTPSLNFNQRETTQEYCGTEFKTTNANVSSRLSVSSSQVHPDLPPKAGTISGNSDFRNFGTSSQSNTSQSLHRMATNNVRLDSSDSPNIAKISNPNLKNQNQCLVNSNNLMNGTSERLKFTDIRNSNNTTLNQIKTPLGNSMEPIRTDSEQCLSSRIVPTFGKRKTNLNNPVDLKATPSFPCGTQNIRDCNTSQPGLSAGNNSFPVTPKTSKFNFKSKTPSVSPSVQTVAPPRFQLPQDQSNGSCNQSNSEDCDSLWQDDDISDEMFTHLTEDMA